MVQRKTAPPTPQDAGSRDISLSIPVAPEMEIVATAQVDALGAHMGMPRDKIDEVRLAVVEACINAFEHAHTRDERLHLVFRVGREEEGADWLEIEVLDQGKGFDHLRIEPPTPEQTFQGKRKRGWGLQIIRTLMDAVQISSGEWGTRIVMRKYK